MQRPALQVMAGKKRSRPRRSPKKPPRNKPEVFLTTAKTVAGHLAMWAVRQNPYPRCPEHLGLVVGRLLYQLKKHAKADRKSNSLMKAMGMFRCDERSLAKLIMRVLLPMREFQRWNERKNGNQEPFNDVSRYDDPTKRDPDNEFIDLGALVRNVAGSVAAEERANDDSSAKRRQLA